MPIDFHVGLFHFEESFAIDLRKYLNRLTIEYQNNTWKIHPDDYSGMSQDFANDLENRLNSKLTKPPVQGPWQIVADDIVVHEIPIDFMSSYHLIIDRGSHLVTHAVGVFMTFAFRGIYIINNPLSFHYFINNKDVGYATAKAIGLNIPPTYILPPIYQNGRPYPYRKGNIDWGQIANDVGFPCYIKPAAGHGGFRVYQVNDIRELNSYYQTSGIEIMTVQKAVPTPYDWQIRCLCIGREIMPVKYRFRTSQYIFEPNFLTSEQGLKVIDHAKVLNRLFGYEMNSVEFILDHQGEPWAIDFNNPIPDARKEILGGIFYNDYLKMMIQRVIEIMIYRPNICYLPELNNYAQISRQNIGITNKLQEAIKYSNQYYNNL